jgi:hypothetical protein
MMRKLLVLGLAALLGTAAAGSVELSKDNFDASVFDSGKSAFVKFFAPWSESARLARSLLPHAIGIRAHTR